MHLFWNPKAKKRAMLFRELSCDILESLQDDRWPSCTDVVMKEIDASIKVSEKDFASFPPGHNYEALAYNVLWDVSYHLIASGNYHLHPGVLNFKGEQLRTICCKAALTSRDKQYLSQDDYDVVMENLSYSIKTFG